MEELLLWRNNTHVHFEENHGSAFVNTKNICIFTWNLNDDRDGHCQHGKNVTKI